MVALLAGSALGAAARLAADQPTEIRISAKKFEFHPNKVAAKRGQPLVLVLTSEDPSTALRCRTSACAPTSCRARRRACL